MGLRDYVTCIPWDYSNYTHFRRLQSQIMNMGLRTLDYGLCNLYSLGLQYYEITHISDAINFKIWIWY